jgi:GNAT superfamily N-acetyltransferase
MDAFQAQMSVSGGALRQDEPHDAWQLKDGTAVVVRAVHSDDGEKMQMLVRGLSLQSRYRRFFHPIHQLVPAMLASFTHADPMHAITLLAVVKEHDEEIVVGMAQYVADPYPQRGEFAVVVADAWQRGGIAARLIRNLICLARAAGIERIEGDVLADNQPMRKLLLGMEFAMGPHPDGAYLIRATKEMAAPAWKCSQLAALALRRGHSARYG